MYRQIQWGRDGNPFINLEPLKITLHIQSFENMPEDSRIDLC